jgi:hypothetical protein
MSTTSTRKAPCETEHNPDAEGDQPEPEWFGELCDRELLQVATELSTARRPAVEEEMGIERPDNRGINVHRTPRSPNAPKLYPPWPEHIRARL